jgi:hypothetical protein
MTKIEAIGLVASLITLFEVGYIVGAWRTRKQRKSSDDELIANRLRQVLGSVRIKKLNCESQRIVPGQTVAITLTVASEAACALEVWIGASLAHHSGREYYDTSQDKPVMLEPGTKIYHRSLTAPSDISHGDYSLIGAVWLGKVANPELSIQLDRFQQEEIVKVRRK